MLRLVVFLFILPALSMACRRDVASQAPIDIFIDVDGLILRKAKGTVDFEKDYIVAASILFEVIPGAVNAFERLSKLEGVRVSLLSAACDARNKTAAEKLGLKVTGGIFSEQYLIDHTVGDVQIPLKDLTNPEFAKMLPGFSTERAILFDDHDYVPVGQRRNLVFVGNSKIKSALASLDAAADLLEQVLSEMKNGTSLLDALAKCYRRSVGSKS